MTDAAIAKLVDEAAIRNLVARLAHMADLAEDLTQYYSLWTEDGVYEVRNPIGWKPGDKSLAKKVSGHAELKKDRHMLRSTGFQGPDTDVWHLNTTLAVTVHDDDSAQAESYWVVVHGRNKPFILRIGHYRDTFRRTPQGWKIAYRVVTPNGGNIDIGTPELLNLTSGQR
jgi:hypothetical protein